MRAILIFLVILIAAPLIGGALLLERTPVVGKAASPAPEDLRRAREALKTFRALTESDAAERELALESRDLQAIGIAASHLVPYLDAHAEIAAGRVEAAAAVRVPRVPIGLWLNVEIGLLPSDEGVKFDLMRIGSIPLPVETTPRLAAWLLDVMLGDDLGQTALQAVDRVVIANETATFRIALSADQRRAFAGRAKSLARGAVGMVGAEGGRRVYATLGEAAATGRLPTTGSAAPFLAEALRLAAADVEGGVPPDVALQGALFALGALCGTHRVEEVVGGLRAEGVKANRAACANLTLAGRVDLRRHFTVSAALEAASDGDTAFAVGEIKELLDAGGGSGFSFPDLAADRAGARFATELRKIDPSDWRFLAALIEDEATVMPTISDFAEGIAEAEFNRTYRDVGSPEYLAALAAIDARIDALPFFGGER